MDKNMQEIFKRLESFSKSLALTVVDILPQMEEALDGRTPLPDRCPSKEVEAMFLLSGIEKKLDEVFTAFVDIKKRLSPETANRHDFIYTCNSGNRVCAQVFWNWDRPPTAKDQVEALPLQKLLRDGLAGS